MQTAQIVVHIKSGENQSEVARQLLHCSVVTGD